jgi:hypothetical protein
MTTGSFPIRLIVRVSSIIYQTEQSISPPTFWRRAFAIVHNALARGQYANAKTAQYARYLVVAVVEAASGGGLALYAGEGRHFVHVLE